MAEEDDDSVDHLVESDDDDPPPRRTSKKKKSKEKNKDGSAVWDRNGKDAQLIAKSIIVGDSDPNNFNTCRDALDEVDDWIDSGRYTLDNLRRNYKKIVSRLDLYLRKGTGKIAMFCSLRVYHSRWLCTYGSFAHATATYRI